MDITCISDLHGHYPKLEGGDFLIVAGDLTASDTLEQHADFNKWLYTQPYRKKIVISGNHDNHFIGLPSDDLMFSFYNTETGEQKSYASYLFDCGIEFEGLKIWGSPWTKTFEGMNPHCKAFTYDTEEELAKKWALIPEDTDILITHGPSMLMHDECIDGTRSGSRSLLNWISNHCQTLKLHVCGHIHEAYGVWDQRKLQKQFNGKEGSVFVNCSHVNERYQPVNKPIRVIL